MKTLAVVVLMSAAFAGFVAGGCSDTCATGGSGCGSGVGGETDSGVGDLSCIEKKNLEPCERGTCVLLARASSPTCLPGPCATDSDCADGDRCKHAFDKFLCMPVGAEADYTCGCSTCCPAGWACIESGGSSMSCIKVCEGQDQCPAGTSCADTELGFMVCVSGT